MASSPTVRRRRIAYTLRKLREEKALTIDDVAAQMDDMSKSTLSRIETSKVGCRTRDAEALFRFYGVAEEQVTELMVIAKQARNRGWWQRFSDVLPDWFDMYVGLEAGASSLRGYDSEVITGMLQTEEYAREVTRATLVEDTQEEVDRKVALRMARQDVLRQDNPPQVWIVLNESVLRRVVGGPEIMFEQLNALSEAAKNPKITIQILPFKAGAHAAMTGTFMILDFPDMLDESVVYVDTLTSALYMEERNEIEAFSRAFDHLRARALDIDTSARMITKIAADYK